ncbi:MAG: AraC family transcriptional regulator [Parachlamydiaceae bacterium]|nr:AraC family transcriptional regulator [Parachlamydiaceae bacterium]
MDRSEDYVKRILKVLIYIEDHIEEDLSLDILAKVACQSSFHFHRIFQAVIGETVHQYVRRLRLERAAGKLLYTKQPVTEIALDANYDTPSAFTRAFKQCMGNSPRNYRVLNKEVNAMKNKIKDLQMIKPDKIEKISDLNLFFIRRFGNYVTSSKIAWDEMIDFIKDNQIDKSKLRYFSISHDDPQVTSEDNLRFDACIQTSQRIQEKGEVSRQLLKGGKYAVFTLHGPHNNLQEMFDRIFLKWLPDSKDGFDDTRPVFCEHFNLDYVNKDESKLITNIFIPIS